MKLSYRWLCDYVDLDGISVEEVAEKLTMGAFEVEEITEVGPQLTGPVVVGEIKEIYPHPNADKIRMTKTVVESGAEPLDIVCGAMNIEVGQRIPVALPGACVVNRKTGEKLPIKASEIRGVKSNGMLCSPNELGIADGDSEGILILSDGESQKYKIGDDVIELLDLRPDWVLHVEPRSNRGDALCVLGLAREIAALTGREYKKDIDLFSAEAETKSDFKVKTEDPEDCQYFTLRMIENIKVKASPSWLVRRLEAVGVRPVNNIVDITNYVMLETGQPLHAYDREKVAGLLEARRAKSGEKLVLIDGKEKELTDEIMVIADQNSACGVAGVMGGKDSEISDNTLSIALEAASFSPARVRRACRLLGLTSDSSQRFERGVDIETVEKASNRAAFLIEKYGGANVKVGPMVKDGSCQYRPNKVKIRVSEVKRILDIDLSTKQIGDYLKALEFEIASENKDNLEVLVPSFRASDVLREIDLIEEVARLYGYNNIEDAMPARTIDPPLKSNFESRVRNILQAQGMCEAWISSLRKEEESGEDSVKVLNPLSKDHQVLRQTLINGLIESAKYNIDHGNKDVWLFELGRGYKATQSTNGGASSNTGAHEYPLVAGVISGSLVKQTNYGRVVTKSDNTSVTVNESKMLESVDFFRVKGLVENLLEKLNIDASRVAFENKSKAPTCLHPYRSCFIKLASDKSKKSKNQNYIDAGWIGEVHPKVLNDLSIKQLLFVFELNLDHIKEAMSPISFEEPAQTPSIVRDLTVDLDMDVEQASVIKLIRNAAGKNLERVDLVSIFELSETKKSLSYRLVFQDKEETLTAEEVEKRLNKVRNTLTYQLSASFRA